MKRREFLQLLGVTATVPLMGTDVVARAIKPVTPIEPVLPVTPVIPVTPIKTGITFEDIGTFDLESVIGLSRERAITEYQCLANFETVKIPHSTSIDAGFRMRVTMKDVRKFEPYFNEYTPIKKVTVKVEDAHIEMKDVYLSELSTMMDASGIILQLRVSTMENQITYKG